jgi:hypothetical protein
MVSPPTSFVVSHYAARRKRRRRPHELAESFRNPHDPFIAAETGC